MRRVLGKQRRLNCSFSLKREREERSETPYNNTFPHVFKGIRSCDDPNTSTIPATTRTKAKRRRQAPTPHNSPNWSQRKGSDTQTDMLQRELCSAICVQRFDDSLGSAIHITYRSSLRSSSMHEPRDPPLKVVNNFFGFFVFFRNKEQKKERVVILVCSSWPLSRISVWGKKDFPHTNTPSRVKKRGFMDWF